MSAEGVNSTVSSPLGQVLQFSFAFMARNFFNSLRRVAVPLLVGGCSLYIFLSLYLSQLAAYLQYPVGSIGGRVLGIAASGMLVMLFLHSVVVSCIVEIILGRQISDRNFLGIKRWQWGLYVANLKLLLVAVIYVSVFSTVRALLGGSSLPAIVDIPLISVAMAPLIWFLVRAWFFLLPVCLEVDEGEVLGRSWQASAGHFWSFVAILIPIILVAAAFQGGGELFLRMLHLIEPFRSGRSFSGNLVLLQGYLKIIVVLISACYFLAVLLTASARMRAYERMVCRPRLNEPLCEVERESEAWLKIKAGFS
ncbi:MAG: hypothetical protein J0I19_17465 [Alphaproteobacteria bacterium]|nr:hypothetical protein [Alphaproteobacteria bacterium]